MASYQNGQPYYPSNNPPSSGQNSGQPSYGSQPPYPSRSLERSPSFDAGDDMRYFNGEEQPPGPQQYQTYSPAPPPMGTSPPVNRTQSANLQSSASMPFRSNTQHAGLTGYQHQYQPGVPPVPAHAPYNPAQYQQPQQPAYNPQAYASPQSAHPASTYQPYVPAAYGDPNIVRRPSVYSTYGYHDPNSQANYSTSQPPPPPPRSETIPFPSPQAYGGYQQDVAQQYQSQYGTTPTGQNHSTYSPPAPAPPPHDSSLSGRPYSRSTSIPEEGYQYTPGSSAPYSTSSLNAYSSPDMNRNASFASRMSGQSASPQPSLPTPPSRQPSNRSPQRTNTLDRHPQGRSLPGVPSEPESDSDYFNPVGSQTIGARNAGSTGYDDLMHHLDEAIGGGSGHARSGSDYRFRDSRDEGQDGRMQQPSPRPLVSPDEVPTHLNGNIASTGEAYINYGAFTDDSDAEAAAGLAAMQALDEQERAEDARRRSGSATLFPSQPRADEAVQRLSSQEQSSDSDYAGYGDLSLAGGGYAPDVSYSEAPVSNYAAAAAMPQSELYGRLNTRMDSVRSSGVSSEGRESQASGFESIPPTEIMHPFSPTHNVARVDTGGTGGLTEPSPHPRRLSYEDGDEATLIDEGGRASGDSSPSRESMPDLFFHPGMSQQRPLPPPPSLSDPGIRIPHLIPAGTYTQQSRFSQYTDPNARGYPAAPDSYSTSLLSPSTVPRSTSLSSIRSAPRVEQVNRSKTDADRQRILRQAQGRPVSDLYDISSPQSAVALDLPAIPKKRYNPAKLSADQFKKCLEPWALSSILAWIKELAEDEADLKENNIAEGLVALFMNKVPTMYITEAEALGERVVKEMVDSNALVREEEWVKFGPGTMSGVLYQLTGTGCYSSKLHLYHTRGRCYSYHCIRTLKKLDVDTLPVEKKSEDWATFYKLKKEDIETHDKKEIERQNVLHEIVTSEDLYISQLDVLRVLYRDRLSSAQPAIVPTKKLATFLREVFGGVDKVKKVNQDYLLGQLKYRQTEQGPWIAGFSDIFREWIRKARPVYVEYASNFPRADYLMRREVERNISFKSFLDQAREDKRSVRLGWDNYLKAPITRLQRYSLLLSTVQKNMLKDSEEKNNLVYALDEIRAATFECDSKFAEMTKKMELIEMQTKLRLRPPMEKEVELNLDHLGREIIFRGELQRAGGKGFQWVDTHAILFDHYLVLAKPLSRDRKEGYYDVSKVPIPMDLLVLESSNEAAVVKSSVKGIGAVTTTVVPRGQVTPDARLARAQSTASGGPGTLTHTNTSLSIGSGNTSQSMVPITTLDSGNSKEEKIMYPFRVKHLGKTETYTLYAPSAPNRQDWCEAIIQAKTRHAEALFSQNAEPFKLRVLADTAFGYEGLSYPPRRILIRGTPLDRAVQEAEKKFEGQGRPAPVCRAPVNCATVFNQPYGRLMCAVGTDFGVFISEYQNSRGWVRAIQMSRVTQIAVLEEFNLFLLISDKALIAYHLDVVCPPSGNPVAQNDGPSRKAPQRLSGSKDIGFFVTGRMKERTLVFYKKRDGIASTFKVLEPVLQKSTTSRSRFLPSASRRGQTEFFREYDEFYIPADCYGLNLFQSSLAISTARGVEVLTLEKKQTWSVPNLRSEQPETQAHLSSIASRIKDLKPLGMFRLGEAEFLVTFEECAVYVNKHGDISRGVVMEFVGRAKAACLYNQYLILVDDDFVEIRDAQNGRLKQVIAGKDIKLLDDGGGGSGGAQTQSQAALGGGMNGLGLKNFGNAPRTPKLVLQHPEYEKCHLVVELLLTADTA